MISKTRAEATQDKYDRIHVIGGKASFTDLMANPPSGSVKMTITPEMAEQMMRLNTRNRPVSKTKLAEYLGQMKQGEWHYTGVPVIFSDAGRLIDGQHRLLACIESGQAFVSDVVFNRPDDSFSYIDIGKTRGASDIFAINGVKNSNGIASMARIVWLYDRGRQNITGGMGGHLTAAELYEAFLQMEYLDLSMPIFHKFQKSRLAPPSLMGAMHHICARKARKAANEFFEIISDGGPDKSSPAVEMHKRLIRNATAVEKYSREGIAGLTLEAWNRYRRGLTGRGLSYSGGRLPAVL